MFKFKYLVVVIILMVNVFGTSVRANGIKEYSQSEIQQQKKEMLKLGYWDFDQSEKGWRSLGEGEGKDVEIAELIDEYVQVNSKLLTFDQKVNLTFHAGQSYAFSGNDKLALKLFSASQKYSNQYLDWIKNNNDKKFVTELSDVYVKTWVPYVQATIAFLEKDKMVLLKSMRLMEKYRNIKSFSNSDEPFYLNRINLKIVKSLYVGLNTGKSYLAAYSDETS